MNLMSMNVICEEYRGFMIKTPARRVLGTVFPVFAEVRNKSDRPELAELLRKRSGDLVQGRSPQEAIENAKRCIDQLLDQPPSAMNASGWDEQYETAIRRFQEHLRRAADGTYRLDATDGRSIGVDDPVVFADLKRSLDETNRKILRGEIDPNRIEFVR